MRMQDKKIIKIIYKKLFIFIKKTIDKINPLALIA
jgi:hypothetical protein